MFGLDIQVSTIDLIIIAVYFVAVFAIGYVVSQRTESGDDLFLAGAQFGLGRGRLVALRFEYLEFYPRRSHGRRLPHRASALGV